MAKVRKSCPTQPLGFSTIVLIDRGRCVDRQAGEIEEWAVSDDLPVDLPVTEAEIDVFEAYFGDLVEAIFSRKR